MRNELRIFNDKKNEIKQFYLCEKKIKKILHMAMQTKYYSEIFKGIDIENITYEQFAKLPILTKSELTKNMTRMLNEGFREFDADIYDNLPYEKKRNYLSKYGLELRVTSGSTGTPVEVIKSRSDLARDYLMLNFYRRRLTKYNFKGSFLWVWPVNPLTKRYFYPDEEAENFWKVNKYGTQYMLYTYSDENLYTMYEHMQKNNIDWITISPSALITFIDFMERKKFKAPELKYIECHSENLYEWQREKINKTFSCEIISIYSSNEVQFIAGTNCNNTMSLFGNNCFMELLENEHGGKNVYLTSLSYLDVPIIRYKLGDCGEWYNNKDDIGNKEFEFELKKYRENDYIVGKNGTKYESFILTDSIVLLQNTYKLVMNMYKVKQTGIYSFEYFFDSSTNLSDLSGVENVLTNYLSQIFDEKVEVVISIVNVSDFFYYGSKMKYIEIDKKLILESIQ